MSLSKLLLSFVAAFALVACTPSQAPAPGTADQGKEQAKPREGDKWAPEEARKKGGTLRWAIYSDPVSLDNHTSTNSSTNFPSGAVYSTLIQFSPYDPERKILQPYLAEKWETSTDGKTITFFLHKGVKWHDGAPFTSEDAKFSILRMKDPDSVNPKPGMFSARKTWFDVVDSVDTPDASTLKVNLKQPSAFFLRAMAAGVTSIMPKHVVMKEGDLSKVMVGTGPFKLKTHTRGVSVEMERNPDYFISGRPYLDGLTQFTVPDASTEFAAFRAGQIEYVGVPDRASEEALKREFPDKLSYYQIRSDSGLTSWKLQTSRPPFNDLRVRKAIDLAIDRDEINKVVYDGQAILAAVMPGGGIFSLPESELRKLGGYRQPKDLDIADAKKLLAEAGYSESKPLRFSTLLGMTRAGDQITELVAGQLKKVGITVEIKPTERAQIYTAWESGNFESGWLTAGLSIEDPDDFFGSHYVSWAPRNYAHWKDEKLDDMYLKQQLLLDPKERVKIVNEMERRVIEQAPYPLGGGTTVTTTAIWGYVKNLYGPVDKNNRLFQDVWLDK